MEFIDNDKILKRPLDHLSLYIFNEAFYKIE
jgi:hypothetical protein